MTVLAGNLPGFEEAYRALYRRDPAGLTLKIKNWLSDIRSYILENAGLDQGDEGTGQ